MIFFIIIMILVIILIFYSLIYKIFSIKNVLNQVQKHLETKYQKVLTKKINKNIYYIEADNKKYLFFIETIPLNTTIQINNSTTWELKIAKSSSAGANHKSSKHLDTIIKFMNMESTSQKIIIFIPNPKKIVMYINECEIVIVNPKTNVYGTNIISVDDINKLK